jgi:hypothetical protein
MSWKSVFIVLVVGALAWSRPAHAEKVKTNQSTKLYSRAGEQSPVILKLKPGQSMTVLAKDGRWIKVRVSGRTGWIPRSKVDMPNDDEEIARNTRRRPFVDGRGTRRGFGGEAGPEDRIGADATGEGDEDAGKPAPRRAAKAAPADDADDARPAPRGKKPSKDDDEDGDPPARARAGKAAKADARDDDKADAKADADASDDGKEPSRPMAHVSKSTPIYEDQDASSETVFTAGPRTALYVLGEKGKWTLVENDEGDAGFVLSSKIETDAAPGGPRSRAITLRGRLGVAVINQSVKTPNAPAMVPDNYGAGSSSVTIALGGSALYPYGKRLWLGGELAYDYDTTLFGGIDYAQSGGTKSTIAFSFHNFNLRALGGYDLQNKLGMIAFGRLGLHYDSFQVSDVGDFTKNTAKIPNQIIYGPTLGGGLAIPRLTATLGLQASLDLMPLSHVEQTVNLEDGTNPGAWAVLFGSALTYHWKPKIDIQVTVDVGYASVSFDGPAPATSMRGHTGMTSTANDTTYTGSVGAAYAF